MFFPPAQGSERSILVQRAIVGFDQDELGDWRAILACGHRQHVRHNPPLSNRPWVLTAEGRHRFLGVALECRACDEGEPVSDGMIAPDALEGVYRQFQVGLVRFIQQRVANPDTAEAIVQDVGLRIHAQVGDLGQDERLASWLYQIVGEAMGDRDGHVQPVATDDHNAATPLADTARGLLACLPGASRQALVMAQYQGLGPQEMAERLDISASEAEVRVRRGRELLREALLDWCHFQSERVGRVLPYQAGCVACADSARVATGDE